MPFRPRLLAGLVTAAFALPAAHAISLIATGTLPGNTGDLSLATAGLLENGVAGNLFGGIGSGLAYAGGSTFLALPDRGPNATPFNGLVADTASYIARIQTLTLGLLAAPNGSPLPYTVAPQLTATTLLWSPQPLTYGTGALGTGMGTGTNPNAGNVPLTLGSGVPALNGNGRYYFTGRSDGFDPGQNSLNPGNARLDPEGIRLSNDGKSVFVSDEYGPYVYQFDRATGERIRAFALPAHFAVQNQGPTTGQEVANNQAGRVANKGMEGLAITPDGKTLVGFMQSPLLQDGGDGGRANRIVTIDIASGKTQEYAYDNIIGKKAFNSSEIVALNSHQFLVLERDGKGLGDGSSAAVKQLWLVDIGSATDVSNLSGEAALLAKAPTKTLFLDLRAALNAAGIDDAHIPAKLEGVSFGQDIIVSGKLVHTLYVANDNDFLPTAPDGKDNPNRWFVFGVTDEEFGAMGVRYEAQALAVPEPETYALMLAGLAAVGMAARRRR